MTKTENYALNQWVGSDRILRTDFNADNAAVEAALTAQQSSIDAHDTLLTAHDNTLDAHDTLLDSHDATIKSHTSTINSHTSTINSHTSSISSLTTKTNTNATNIANLTETVGERHDTRLRLITGSYTGNDAADRTINIGTDVSVIFIWREGYEARLKDTFCILPMEGAGYNSDYTGTSVTHTGKGFKINNAAYFNGLNQKYRYTAFTYGN